ncbi:hypothetical protein WQ54_13260 [Bacillus sp. SA1-12]|nr:hypothetical protein WQ54_13260 [Bacillus sp. SA1-12]
MFVLSDAKRLLNLDILRINKNRYILHAFSVNIILVLSVIEKELQSEPNKLDAKFKQLPGHEFSIEPDSCHLTSPYSFVNSVYIFLILV